MHHEKMLIKVKQNLASTVRPFITLAWWRCEEWDAAKLAFNLGNTHVATIKHDETPSNM
jgi:hypothetical protein